MSQSREASAVTTLERSARSLIAPGWTADTAQSVAAVAAGIPSSSKSRARSPKACPGPTRARMASRPSADTELSLTTPRRTTNRHGATSPCATILSPARNRSSGQSAPVRIDLPSFQRPTRSGLRQEEGRARRGSGAFGRDPTGGH